MKLVQVRELKSLSCDKIFDRVQIVGFGQVWFMGFYCEDQVISHWLGTAKKDPRAFFGVDSAITFALRYFSYHRITISINPHFELSVENFDTLPQGADD